MVRKGILIIIIIALTISIVLDLYNTRKINSNSDMKLNYLETLTLKDDLTSIYNIISSCYTRPSLWHNYYRFLELDPDKVPIDKPIEWESYIEKDDLLNFNKEIKKIPKLKTSIDNRIYRVRNKLIFLQLINYAAGKVYIGREIVCLGGYRLVQDVFHNITLTFNCGFSNTDISINGITLDDQLKFPITLPKSNELDIELSEKESFRWPMKELTCTTSTIDISSLLNKTH